MREFCPRKQRVLRGLSPNLLILHNGATTLRSQPPFTGVLKGPGRKVPPRSAFLSVFGHLVPSAQKHSKKHSGGALSGPGP